MRNPAVAANDLAGGVKSLLLLARNSAMLEVTINGQARSFETLPTVAGLLQDMDLVGKRLAVERNGEIVPRGRHAETQLAPGDKLEIVVAVGGG
jgi:sulfur carrier protein